MVLILVIAVVVVVVVVVVVIAVVVVVVVAAVVAVVVVVVVIIIVLVVVRERPDEGQAASPGTAVFCAHPVGCSASLVGLSGEERRGHELRQRHPVGWSSTLCRVSLRPVEYG